ncbi:MAG: serine hydrolase domain-containing protein [Steroidobacteraceae bacterium]
MQRVLVILTVSILVAVSLGVGALAANWPFWQRAWQWHHAAGAWPAQLAGPVERVRGGADAQQLQFHADASLVPVAATATTRLLLRANTAGQVDAFFAPGFSAGSQVDGRGLSGAVLAPLFAVLGGQHPGLLDLPVAQALPAWHGDPRGQITARQLFWHLSGLPALSGHALNPFGVRARLNSGPDFARAALHWPVAFPPGTHFEESPVNAQLLSLVAAAHGGASYARVLEQQLWSRFAADDALLLLDHRRGNVAAHCCLRATAADWVRLALLLAADGRSGRAELWTRGYMAQVTQSSPVHNGYGLGFQLLPYGEHVALSLRSYGRHLLIAPDTQMVLLWVGEGEPPPGLEQLLLAHSARSSEPGGD